MDAAKSGGITNSPTKTMKSTAARAAGRGWRPAAGRARSAVAGCPPPSACAVATGRPADSTASSTTVTSGASATCSPCRVRRVDISRSSVSAVGDQPPTASSRSRRMSIPLPRSSAVPSVDQRPHWLAMSISCSSSCAAVSQPMRRLASRRCTWSAAASGSRDQAAMARDRKSAARWASASITATTSPRTCGCAQASTAPLVRGPVPGSRRQTVTASGADAAAARASSPVPSDDPSSRTRHVEAPPAVIGIVLRQQVGHDRGDHRRLVSGRDQDRHPRAFARRWRWLQHGHRASPASRARPGSRRTAATGRWRPAAAARPARR